MSWFWTRQHIWSCKTRGWGRECIWGRHSLLGFPSLFPNPHCWAGCSSQLTAQQGLCQLQALEEAILPLFGRYETATRMQNYSLHSNSAKGMENKIYWLCMSSEKAEINLHVGYWLWNLCARKKCGKAAKRVRWDKKIIMWKSIQGLALIHAGRQQLWRKEFFLFLERCCCGRKGKPQCFLWVNPGLGKWLIHKKWRIPGAGAFLVLFPQRRPLNQPALAQCWVLPVSNRSD